MENLLDRLRRALWLRASRISCPESRTKIIHSRINGYDLLVLANEDVGRSIVYGGSYESVESSYLRKRIRPDAVCLDIGANIGYFTMLLARVAIAGSVHAFEPISLNAALLSASIELNGFSNIIVNQCAVGAYTGDIFFSEASDSAYSSILDTKRKPLNRTRRVPLITLDKYLDQSDVKRVDFLKADVEGAEGLVVAGASKLLSDETRRPQLVLLELFDKNLRVFGTSVANVLEEMTKFGYQPFVITDDETTIPFTDELKTRYYNILFRPTVI